jgi:imidazolonepropionase-like amidohydrolase
LAYPSVALAQEDPGPKRILFTNVNVFDGVSETLDMDTNVLVEDNLIAAVGPSMTLPEGAEVIDGSGRTLMPGLMDAHVHLALVRRPDEILNDYDWMYVGALANEQAQEMLLRGFTTVRDIGGPTVLHDCARHRRPDGGLAPRHRGRPDHRPAPFLLGALHHPDVGPW